MKTEEIIAVKYAKNIYPSITPSHLMIQDWLCIMLM